MITYNPAKENGLGRSLFQRYADKDKELLQKHTELLEKEKKLLDKDKGLLDKAKESLEKEKDLLEKEAKLLMLTTQYRMVATCISIVTNYFCITFYLHNIPLIIWVFVLTSPQSVHSLVHRSIPCLKVIAS